MSEFICFDLKKKRLQLCCDCSKYFSLGKKKVCAAIAGRTQRGLSPGAHARKQRDNDKQRHVYICFKYLFYFVPFTNGCFHHACVHWDLEVEFPTPRETVTRRFRRVDVSRRSSFSVSRAWWIWRAFRSGWKTGTNYALYHGPTTRNHYLARHTGVH